MASSLSGMKCATHEASLFESALARLEQEPSLAEELCLLAWPRR